MSNRSGKSSRAGKLVQVITGVLILAQLTFITTPQAMAALPPLNSSELMHLATHVVTAEVVAIKTQQANGDYGDTRFIIHLRVDAIQKQGFALQNTLAVTTWQATNRPIGWSGRSGQRRVPVSGGFGQFYLDTQFRMLQPNGWLKLKQPKKQQ